MTKAWLVAKREYLSNIHRPGFLFGMFGVPLIIIVVTVVISLVAVQSEEDAERLGAVGYIDRAGVLRADNDPFGETLILFTDETAARAALDAREIGAYFVVPENYLQQPEIAVVSREETPRALRTAFTSWLVRSLGRDADLPPDLLERIQEPAALNLLTLDSGRVIGENGMLAVVLAPIIFVLIFLLATQTTSGILMSSVVEEKSGRIMEILITSVTPFQLLFGKILGLGALGLTQLAIWGVMTAIALRLGQGIEFIDAISIPPDLVLAILVYFVLQYAFISALMATIGAISGSEQESRQLAGIFGLFSAVPFFVFAQFISEPDSPLIVFLTLFPLTSPMSMIMRLGFTAVPLWQIGLSIGLLLLTTLFVVWAGAKLFRYSILMYGKRPTPREMLRVLRSSSGMGTTATGHSEG